MPALRRRPPWRSRLDDGAVGDAGGIAAARQEPREVHEMLAAHRFEAFELGQRIGVVVDAQIEVGPCLLAVDDERRRLFAALIAAGRLARAQGGDQPARQGQRLVRRVGRRGVLDHARRRRAYCRRRKFPGRQHARTNRRRPPPYAPRCGLARQSREAADGRGPVALDQRPHDVRGGRPSPKS